MIINEEFRSLIPKQSAEEYQQLETNILADGCRDPLVVWNDTLLDGHSRYEICEKHGLQYNQVSLQLADADAAKVWIIRNQFGRRNITLAARCELAEKLAEALKPKAKENQKGFKGNQHTAPLPKLAKDQEAIDTRAQAAKEAGVSHGSLAAYRYLKENAEPAELETLKRDPNAKLHKVVKDVKERKQKAIRQEKRLEAAKDTPLDERIIVGDFREHADTIADNSLALVFTDPPYNADAIELFDSLGRFAAEKLAEGGSLLCYVGQTQLTRALDVLRGHLRYWWTIACIHAGRATVMREYGINAQWKPVVWFVRGTRDDNSVMVNDTMSGGQEKDFHEWQQAQSEAEYWIQKLCPVDGIVCDPFMGGGTTAAAAQKLNREWIGFEIDPATAQIASGRLHQ